jgi:hypothetical protein
MSGETVTKELVASFSSFSVAPSQGKKRIQKIHNSNQSISIVQKKIVHNNQGTAGHGSRPV